MVKRANMPAIIYAAAAIVQAGSVLVASLVAAKEMSLDDYAQLAFVQALVVAGALVLDLGIGQSALRLSAVEGRPEPMQSAIFIKLIILVLSLAFSVAIYWKGFVAYSIALTGAAAASVNLTLRIHNAQNRDFVALVLGSIVMLGALAIGFATTIYKLDPWRLSIAIFVIPPVLGILVSASRSDAIMSDKNAAKRVLDILRYAPYVFVSGALFALVAPICQLLAKHRLAPDDFACLALSFSVAGAANMLVTAYRSVAYSMFASRAVDVSKSLGIQMREFLVTVSTFSGIYGAVSMSTLVVARIYYDHKYEGLVEIAMLLSAAFLATSVLGFFNIRYQVRGLRWVEIGANAGRLLLAVMCSVFAPPSSLIIAAIVGLSYVLGELAYLMLGHWVCIRRA